jgi:hypothetical protein
LSFGISYRFVSLGIGFTPAFLNSNAEKISKGETERFDIGAGFSFGRLYTSAEYSKVQGFYLDNIKDFAMLTDTPYILFPNQSASIAGIFLRYNLNRKFSVSGISGGTQQQLRSAFSVLPSFYGNYFKFKSDDTSQKPLGIGYMNNMDFNLVLPLVGTLVIGKNGYITGGAGFSLGLDFFNSVSYYDTSQQRRSNGTSVSTGYFLKAGAGYNQKRFFCGTEYELRGYGHSLDNSAGIRKKFSYLKLYFGWRIHETSWEKKTLDWINKTSPVKLE